MDEYMKWVLGITAILFVGTFMVPGIIQTIDAEDQGNDTFIIEMDGYCLVAISLTTEVSNTLVSVIQYGEVVTSIYFEEPWRLQTVPVQPSDFDKDGAYTVVIYPEQGDAITIESSGEPGAGDGTLSLGINDATRGWVSFMVDGETVHSGDRIDQGSTVIMMVVPGDSYGVDSVTLNGKSLDGVNDLYTFLMPSQAEVYVTFGTGDPTPDGKTDGTLYVVIVIVILLALIAIMAIRKLR